MARTDQAYLDWARTTMNGEFGDPNPPPLPGGATGSGLLQSAASPAAATPAAPGGGMIAQPFRDQGIRSNQEVGDWLRGQGYSGAMTGGAGMGWLAQQGKLQDYYRFIADQGSATDLKDQGRRTNNEVADWLRGQGYTGAMSGGAGMSWLAQQGRLQDYFRFIDGRSFNDTPDPPAPPPPPPPQQPPPGPQTPPPQGQSQGQRTNSEVESWLRQRGYTGPVGQGEAMQWLAQNGGMQDYFRFVSGNADTALKDQGYRTNNEVGAWLRSQGYTGPMDGSGAGMSWLARTGKLNDYLNFIGQKPAPDTNPAPQYQPGTTGAPGSTGYYWTPQDDRVETAVASIIDKGGPLMTMAGSQGRAAAARRGLLNSTMGVGSGQQAVLNTALAMGSQNAGQTFQKNLSAQGYAQSRGLADQSYEHSRGLADQAFGHETALTTQRGDIQSRLQSEDGEIRRGLLSAEYGLRGTLSAQEHQQATNLAEINNAANTRIANMQTSAHDRQYVMGGVQTMTNQYMQVFNSIANNPDIPADARNAYLAHIGTMMNTTLTMIEQVYGVDLTWDSPTVAVG